MNTHTSEASPPLTGEAFVLPAALVAEFDELVSHYPARRAALIPALHRCQEELGGWLSPEVLEACAEFFELEPVEVFGVASFYPMFHLKPRGTHLIGVCHNISCELRGASAIMDKLCQVTGAPAGGTSPDGKFTLKGLECQGACTNAPMIDLDGVYHENLTAYSVEQLIRSVE